MEQVALAFGHHRGQENRAKNKQRNSKEVKTKIGGNRINMSPKLLSWTLSLTMIRSARYTAHDSSSPFPIGNTHNFYLSNNNKSKVLLT